MSDKIQLIKEEIERRISQFEAKYPKDLGGYWNDEESAAHDCAEEYKRFLLFIDSIPEESVSKDKINECLNWDKDWGCSISPMKNCDTCPKAEWVEANEEKQKSVKSASEDLEEAAYKYRSEHLSCDAYTVDSFKAGAEWQRNQMMKNTVLETTVMMDCDGDGIEIPYYQWLTLENTEILSLPDNIGLKDGDKVKIIIVKEE